MHLRRRQEGIGEPYGNIRKSFFMALNRVDIIDFHFHDLRHTFASQSVMAGLILNSKAAISA
jgi:integrase